MDREHRNLRDPTRYREKLLNGLDECINPGRLCKEVRGVRSSDEPSEMRGSKGTLLLTCFEQGETTDWEILLQKRF